jgi:hypothetical protein
LSLDARFDGAEVVLTCASVTLRLTIWCRTSGNEAAIAGYEKAGFRVAERKLDERFASSVGAPGMVRLERPL